MAGYEQESDVVRWLRELKSNVADLATLASSLSDLVGRKKTRSGKVMVTWPGGSTVSNWMTVQHDLGRLPTEAFGTLNDQSNTGFCFLEVLINSDTQVSVRLATNGFAPASSTTSPVSWQVRG